MTAFLTQDHPRWTLRLFSIVMLVPVAIGAASAWSFLLTMLLLLIGVPAVGILFVTGTIVLSWRGIGAARSAVGWQRGATRAVAPVVATVTLLLAQPVAAAANHLAWLVKLGINHSRYEAIIADARCKATGGRTDCRAGADDGVVGIDPGPPLRAAFDPQGLLDNWTGIVFDPSGDVMRARGFDPVTGKFAAPDRITKLFGGDLVACRRLFGDYYRCSFT